MVQKRDYHVSKTIFNTIEALNELTPNSPSPSPPPPPPPNNFDLATALKWPNLK